MARRLDYFFKETFQGLRRNGLVAFAAVSTAFIALFLLGGALLVQKEASLLIDQANAEVQVSIYLSDEISPSQLQQLQRLLADMPDVAKVDFESKEQAYAHFKELFKDQQDLVRNVSTDAIPASFRVDLKNPERFEVVRAQLAGQPGIDTITDHREIYNRLFAVTRIFRVGVLAVALIMLIASAALIGNTVRMAVFARRKEIGIMRLVGATNWFIRVPFVIEGVVEGLLGAGAAILALFIMKTAFIDPLRNNVGFLALIRTGDVISTIPFLLGGGVVVAVVASLIAMRRFLEV
jgi:cell division transport system permease protein